MILSDYGKLKFVGTAIETNQPGYLWSAGVQGSVATAENALMASANRWTWGRLMPVAWDQWVVPNANLDESPVTPLDPQHWICNGGPPWQYPFADTPADGTG